MFIDVVKFQLHHTGIKTRYILDALGALDHFNCTIQELKHFESKIERAERVDFNCTIQELKHFARLAVTVACPHFNCTIQELKHDSQSRALIVEVISIAPYRN